jgi:hypothetical protein
VLHGDLSLEFVTARLFHEEHKRNETIPTSEGGEKALLSTKYDQINPRNPNPKRKGKWNTGTLGKRMS